MKKCVECGAEFKQWPGKVYCSAKCRSRSYSRLYRLEYPERERERARRYTQRFPGLRCELARNRRLRKYGLDHDPTIGASCAACWTDTNLVIDHDHATGQVRGVLCQKCNIGIGMLGDCAGGVAAALEYMKRAA